MLFEDVLAPRLDLTVKERAVYSYLLRHGRQAPPAVCGYVPSRHSGPLHRRVLVRNKTGHLVEMRLPEKIRAILPGKNGASIAMGSEAAGEPPAATLETRDFLKTWALRKGIHARERGACFYCLRRTLANVRCLDHVVPRVRFGRNSYRNLVSCCLECNSRKSDRAARDFLRTLYRQGRLTPGGRDARLRALKDLAAGRLRPSPDFENRK